MRRLVPYLCLAFLLMCGFPLHATIFGRIQGIVHDPQHRPVTGATVKLQAITSDWSETTQTDDDGEFSFAAVPIGDYKITVNQPKFQTSEQTVTVDAIPHQSCTFNWRLRPSIKPPLSSAGQKWPTWVRVTPATLVDRQDISQTPGSDRTNSLAMITDYTPGAYVSHDMLHMRGGHQVEWLIDGVPLPNTNIAANIAPVIDPKDIDYLEIQRGSYDADLGGRTYGMFNIVPRNGFERNHEAELVLSFGNWYQTNNQLNFGSHTDRFAYYVSLNGNRSNYGLQTPVAQVFHDAENGYGGFASFIFNRDSKNRFQRVTSLPPSSPSPLRPGPQLHRQ